MLDERLEVSVGKQQRKAIVDAECSDERIDGLANRNALRPQSAMVVSGSHGALRTHHFVDR